MEYHLFANIRNGFGIFLAFYSTMAFDRNTQIRIQHVHLFNKENQSNKPGGGYGALGGATNIKATAEARENKQTIILICHKLTVIV